MPPAPQRVPRAPNAGVAAGVPNPNPVAGLLAGVEEKPNAGAPPAVQTGRGMGQHVGAAGCTLTRPQQAAVPCYAYNTGGCYAA